MTLLAAVLVVIQGATGAGWWALVRRHGNVSILELVGMGLALGTFASMLLAVLLFATPLAPIGSLVPTIIVVPVLLWAWRRGLFSNMRVTAPRRESIAGVVGLVSGLALIIFNWSRIPLSAPPADSFTDLYFFEALSRGLAEFGPGQSIFMSGGSLRYHWFSYAWAGELAENAGTGPFVTITRVLPVVTLIGVTAIVAAWSARLSRIRWVPALAVLLVVAGGYAGGLYGAILNFDSPSQAMTTMWLLGVAVAFLVYTRGDVGWPALLALAALAAATTGGKISHALVAAGGMGLVFIVGAMVRASWWRRALAAGAVAGASMAATYVLVLSGVAVDRNLAGAVAVKASTWQGLDPVLGRVGLLLGTGALLLAILARLGGLAWLQSRRGSRVKPDVLFATGGLLVGIVTLAVLRDGINELWFVLAASAPAAVLSADGIGSALRHVKRDQRSGPLRRPMLWSIVIALPASVACLVLSLNWSTHQVFLNWLAPVVVWVLVPFAAVVVVFLLGRGRPSLLHAVALSIAGLAIVSIATRPAAIWTPSRPITTAIAAPQPLGAVPSPDAPLVAPATLTQEERYNLQTAAASWVVAHTNADSLIATGNTRAAVVPALTGRQMYLAGDVYQAGLGRADELDEVKARFTASYAFAVNPSALTARPLCEAGVDLVWLDIVSSSLPADTVAFSNDAVTVVDLENLGCPSPARQ